MSVLTHGGEIVALGLFVAERRRAQQLNSVLLYAPFQESFCPFSGMTDSISIFRFRCSTDQHYSITNKLQALILLRITSKVPSNSVGFYRPTGRHFEFSIFLTLKTELR